MNPNKIVINDKVALDLTSDTVTPDTLLSGVTAHSADGEEIVGNVITHNVIDNLESTSSEDALSANQGRVLNEVLYKKNRPYFIFIDDDGRTNFNDIYTNVLVPRGIKAGLSICMTDALIGKTGYLTLDELKTYEANGNDILCHSTSINSIELSTADAVFRYCISQINKYGFKSNGIFVYPNGNTGSDKEAIEDIASNYFTYGININYNHNCPVSIPIGNKQDIGRIFINPAGQNTDTVKSYYKNLIDDAFANNKLMIISTHSNSCEVAYLEEVLDYIISNGGIFGTPASVLNDVQASVIDLKQDKLVAGENITIENNVISATGGGNDELISDAYSAEITYHAGDCVIYNNLLYKCKLTCVGTEPTDTDYWEQTSVSTELGGVRFGIDGDGNYGYYKADGSFVPFKSGVGIPVKTGIITMNTGTTETIPLGFKPKQIAWYRDIPDLTAGYFYGFLYDANTSETQFIQFLGTQTADGPTDIGTGGAIYRCTLMSMDDNSFTVYSRMNRTCTFRYFAIGESGDEQKMPSEIITGITTNPYTIPYDCLADITFRSTITIPASGQPTNYKYVRIRYADYDSGNIGQTSIGGSAQTWHVQQYFKAGDVIQITQSKASTALTGAVSQTIILSR